MNFYYQRAAKLLLRMRFGFPDMDKVTRYEWHGNTLVLLILFLTVITIPTGLVYLFINFIAIETEIDDGEKFSEYLRSRK